ncbi:MAG: nucleoside-triphosphatase [Sphaerochaeta sp.]
MQASLTLVVADRDHGKTTFLLNLLKQPSFQEKRICGVLALANPEKTMYRLRDLSSLEERLALCESLIGRGNRIGRFFLDEQVFSWANQAIRSSLGAADVAIFDEIGRLEFEGGGLAPSFKEALDLEGLQVYAAVRRPFIDDLLREFSIRRERLSILEVDRLK